MPLGSSFAVAITDDGTIDVIEGKAGPHRGSLEIWCGSKRIAGPFEDTQPCGFSSGDVA